MKRIVLILSLLLLAAHAATAAIHIVVDARNATLRELAVVYQTTVRALTLDSTGHGTLTINDVQAVHARLFHGQSARQFFMEDGDTLRFTYDAADFAGTLQLDGVKSRILRYFAAVSYAAPAETDFARPFEEYKQLVAEKEQAAQKTLDAWRMERVSPRFALIEQGRIHYAFAQNLMMYAAAHPLVAADPNWMPTADYVEAVRTEAVERPELGELHEYREYMAEAARILDTDAPEGISYYDRTLRKINYLADHIKADTLRQQLINALAIDYVNMKGTDSIAELRALQGAFVELPALNAAFDRTLAAHDATAPGRPSPAVAGQTLDGQTVRLADFRGRYVYIDIWASWCGPCRAEFPHLKKLEAEMAGRNIAFLGLSTDRDEAAWRKVAVTLGGTQLLIGTSSDFLTAYRVDGIPRFILIDPNGRIVNAEMTRPSDAETLTFLKNLPGI